jgi:Na+/serine symporter
LTEKNEKQSNRNNVSITLYFILLCQTLWFLLLCFSFFCVKHYGFYYFVFYSSVSNIMVSITVFFILLCQTLRFLLLCFSFFCVKHYGFYYFVFHSSASNTMVSITLIYILLCQKQSNINHSVWHRRMKNKVIETVVFDTV